MDAQWLQTQFDVHKEKTKAGLAKVLGLEPPAISKILKGTRQIKAHEYIIMRRYFGLPVDGEKTVGRQNTLLKPFTPQGKSSYLAETKDTSNDDSWMIPKNILHQHTKASPDQIQIFTIEENTMAPDFRRGDPVLIDLSNQTPSPPGTFIISDGYSHQVRQCELIAGSQPTHVRISARDESFLTQTLELSKVNIIGRVIAKLQWL